MNSNQASQTNPQSHTILIQQPIDGKKKPSSDTNPYYIILLTSLFIFVAIIISLLVVLLVLGLNGRLSTYPFVEPQLSQAQQNNLKHDPSMIVSKNKPYQVDFLRNRTKQHQNETQTARAQSCGVSYYENSVSLTSNSRIINGYEANYGSQPWIVSIRTVTSSGILSQHVCGGSIITDQHVLTAAHCLDNLSAGQVVILIGIQNLYSYSEENIYFVDNFYVHEGYPGSLNNIITNDIALIKLDRVVETSNKVQIICLPSLDDFPIERDVIVSGWGNVIDGFDAMLAENLKTINLRIENDNAACDLNGPWDSENLFCVLEPSSNPDSNVCFGDSGGPLVGAKSNRWKLYGITSYVSVDKDIFGRSRCLANKPSYFTNVAQYLDWILQRTVL